jgi:thiol-disulfide isomerase/thioredoxin
MRGYVLAALLLATACTRGADPKPDPSLPPIALDPCPAAADLLQGTPSGGTRLPDVSLPCLGSDATVNMRALGAKPAVVNLWGSWCDPCRKEMPDFQNVYMDLKGELHFLGVDTKDFERPARSAIQRAGVSYPSVFDKDERVRRAINARTLPATVLIDANGVVKDVHVGQLTEAELRQAIAKHLGVS